MEFKKPKPKKNAPNFKPVLQPSEDFQFLGVFNGLNVTVTDPKAKNSIYHKGYYGKGSLSKSSPIYGSKKDDVPEIIPEHQFLNQKKLTLERNENFQTSSKWSDYYYQLSYNSVSDFLKATQRDSKNNSWENYKMETQCETLRTSETMACNTSKNRKCIQLLEFTKDEDPKIDKGLELIASQFLLGKSDKIDKDKNSEKQVLVISFDSDCDSANVSLEKINVRLEKKPCMIEESLILNLEEAFYLNFIVKCLRIVDLNNIELNSNLLWEKFNGAEPNFLERYVIYQYYRLNGWVVRSGLKYGGDYLLYVDGPDYNHSSYLIKIVNNENPLSWVKFLAINRLVETFNKDVVFCTVTKEDVTTEEDSPLTDGFKNYRVHEFMSRRWFPTKERIVQQDDETLDNEYDSDDDDDEDDDDD